MASNTHQRQSLNDRLLFQNGDIEDLLPPECALIILTATLSTPSTFLLHHFLHHVLRTSAEHSEGAVYLSFLVGKNGLYSSMKRLGVDLAQCTQQNRFVYVDGFSRLFLPNATQTSSVLTLGSQSKWILSIAQIILLALDTLQTEKKSLFIEGLDFVLAAGSENITPLDILTTLSVLSEKTSRTFVSFFADSPLLDLSQKTVTSQNQSVLVKSFIHRAHSVISLRPLETGSARDVDGIIRVTRGGRWYDFQGTTKLQSPDHSEWETLYHIEDGRAKLFGP